MSTIVSLATGNINCAIHIIRISGAKTFEIVNQITSQPILRKGYEIQRSTIYDGTKKIDDVIILKYLAPNSYTGEDVIEICCHGSYYIAQKIIAILIRKGCKLASKGEFTKRAYLNNKINLIQAQAINNLVNSNSDLSLKLANLGLSKDLETKILYFKEKIFKLLGLVEVSIDYPEYDKENLQKFQEAILEIKKVKHAISKLIIDSKKVLPIRDNFKIAIVGKPNVGKSSLLNLLSRDERSIVSNIPGTTRDVVSSFVEINGIRIELLDTAGIHEFHKDIIEQKGIIKSKEEIKKSDLVLLILDGSKSLDHNDHQLMDLIKNKNSIVVINKNDLRLRFKLKDAILISVKEHKIESLIKEIKKHLMFSGINWDKGLFLQSKQEIILMEKINQNIDLFLKEIPKKTPLDLIVDYLKESYEGILELIGETKNTNFIDELFKNFCVGK